MIAGGAEGGGWPTTSGAAVLKRQPGAPVAEAEIVTALAATQAHTSCSCSATRTGRVAERAAAAARREGQDVLVLPTGSVLQSLAALAVHDPAAPPGADIVAMAEAAGGSGIASLVVAETEALTWVGRCQPGDVLGIADGEVVLIAPDLPSGRCGWLTACSLGGGEIVTVLLGAGTDAALADGLGRPAAHPSRGRRLVHRGGLTDRPVELGVE